MFHIQILIYGFRQSYRQQSEGLLATSQAKPPGPEIPPTHNIHKFDFVTFTWIVTVKIYIYQSNSANIYQRPAVFEIFYW